VLKECRNSNITNFYESFIHDSRLYIVMEYVAGGSVKDILRIRGALQEIYIAIIMKELLIALSYIHSQKKLHRDVKGNFHSAANILLSLEGNVKLADFGVSAQISESVNKRNSFVGTLNWMAPEVITQSDYDHKADIWSVGITGIELAQGYPPYFNMQPLKALIEIQSGAPPQLDSSFSQTFREFTSLCLQKDPEKRPDAEMLLNHRFIKSAKKTYYLTDLLDPSTIIRREHFRSSSTQSPINTVLRLTPSENSQHRHSRSSGNYIYRPPISQKAGSNPFTSRSGSVCSDSSNTSIRTTVVVPDCDEISSGPHSPKKKLSLEFDEGTIVDAKKLAELGTLQEPSFLTVLERAVNNIESRRETMEALEGLVVAIAQLEIKEPGLAPKIFGEVAKIYKTEYPADYHYLFS
jgi:serine/threonine protein kinase